MCTYTLEAEIPNSKLNLLMPSKYRNLPLIWPESGPQSNCNFFFSPIQHLQHSPQSNLWSSSGCGSGSSPLAWLRHQESRDKAAPPTQRCEVASGNTPVSHCVCSINIHRLTKENDFIWQSWLVKVVGLWWGCEAPGKERRENPTQWPLGPGHGEIT